MLKLIAVSLVASLPIVCNAGLCETVGTVAQTTAQLRDTGLSEHDTLSVYRSSDLPSKTVQIISVMVHDIYTIPGFQWQSPDQLRAGYIKACYAQNGS